MNSKNTRVWLLLAAALFATIYCLDHYLHPAPPDATRDWPKFQVAQATSVQVIPSGALEIRADHTNGTWYLSSPISYPAQPAAIEALLDSLDKLTPASRLSASDLRQQPTADKDYGFDVPQVSLDVTTPNQQWQLKIGRRTPPGNQVYLRVVGVDGAFVTDSRWLKYLPKTANDWRDTSLVSAGAVWDSIVLTNGAKVIELQLNPTNRLWRMVRPLQARADSDRIGRALEQLRAARVKEFVTDDEHADLGAFELQPADLDLWLGRGGVLADGLHLGKSPTNDASLVFARREGWNGVVTTSKDSLALWRGAVGDFRDPHLLELTSPVNEIEVQAAGTGTHYLLQQASNAWHVAGEDFPVSNTNVANFLGALAGLTVREFVSDVATAPDLQNYGLTKPNFLLTLRPKAGDTNQTLVQLAFSAAQTNGSVYARRSDEDSIYRLNADDVNAIPEYGWQFRDRQIWSFPVQSIAQITIRQDGKTRQIVHNGYQQWALAPGSTGEIFPPEIEETATQLADMYAVAWVFDKITDPARFGVTDKSLEIEIQLKDGRKFTLDFGLIIANNQLGLVTLDGERWAFVMSNEIQQLVLSYLTIPVNVH